MYTVISAFYWVTGTTGGKYQDGKISMITVKKIVNWHSVKEAFIFRSVQMLPEGETYSLADLAKSMDIPYGTIRNRSAKENWLGSLKERVELHNNHMAKVSLDENVFNEIAVRKRHATVSSFLITKGMAHLEIMKNQKMNAKIALTMIKLGMEAEAVALGFDKQFNISIDVGVVDSTIAREKHQSTLAAAEKLKEYLTSKGLLPGPVTIEGTAERI